MCRKKIGDWLQNSTTKKLNLPAENAYRRRLIHQEVAHKYNGYLSTEGQATTNSIDVSRLTETEKEQHQNLHERLLQDLDELRGFQEVFGMLMRSGKPVVGHNMYLDVCQTLEKFYRVLPEGYAEFKEMCNRVFPM
jgi:poly(A)-specific ribonuclease